MDVLFDKVIAILCIASIISWTLSFLIILASVVYERTHND